MDGVNSGWCETPLSATAVSCGKFEIRMDIKIYVTNNKQTEKQTNKSTKQKTKTKTKTKIKKHQLAVIFK